MSIDVRYQRKSLYGPKTWTSKLFPVAFETRKELTFKLFISMFDGKRQVYDV